MASEYGLGFVTFIAVQCGFSVAAVPSPLWRFLTVVVLIFVFCSMECVSWIFCVFLSFYIVYYRCEFCPFSVFGFHLYISSNIQIFCQTIQYKEPSIQSVIYSNLLSLTIPQKHIQLNICHTSNVYPPWFDPPLNFLTFFFLLTM